MKTWLAATCIAIGLMALINSSAAMPPQTIFVCMMAAFYDKSKTAELQNGLENVVNEKNFKITADEVAIKYSQFPKPTINYMLIVPRDGVVKFISIESYVGSFSSILGYLKIEAFAVASLTPDIEKNIPAGHFIWIMFITIAGPDGRIEYGEYKLYVTMFIRKPNEEDVKKTWKKINPDADKGQPGSEFCDLAEFQEICTTVGIAGQISVALYH